MAEKDTFSQRYSEFRKEVANMDWTADGVNTNQGWTFLSESKIKGQLSPALAKYGIGWAVSYSDLKVMEPVGAMKQHYIVTVHVKITDLLGTTDTSLDFEAFGEGADSGDKGISKAQTNALKNVIANNFLLSSYTVEAESSLESATSAKAEKTPLPSRRDKETAKEVLQAISEPIPTATPAPAPTPAPATPTGKGLNQIQTNAMNKIIASARVADPITLEPYGGLDAIEMAYYSAINEGDSKKAAEFIKTFKTLVAI